MKLKEATMSASELRKRLGEAKVGQFFNICVDAITYAERLEEEIEHRDEEILRLREALVNSDVKIIYLLSDIDVSKARWEMQHRANLAALERGRMTDEKIANQKTDTDLYQLSNHTEPISTLSADERARLRHKMATYIEDARYYHRQWRRQGEVNLDATQEITRLRKALAECEAEIDIYIDHRYPLYTHPIYDRKNRDAKEANPARVALREPRTTSVQSGTIAPQGETHE